MKHGNSAYSNRGCRCDECRAGHSAYQQAYRHRPRDPESLLHGTNSTYTNHRCRCDECRAAAVASVRQYRRRLAAASRSLTSP
jgi:hypothetical protein